ncbi:MAG: acylphosphatase [Bacteroidetes bacterium SW_11_45_7]|nr:MAG: acylphosphatase [Bacteroidetes bacterium SW_11_45_7]
MDQQHWIIRVEGKVQGVFFRAETRNKAEQLGLKGYVKNERDGSVLIEAEGREDELKQLKKWCREGPPAARVNNVSARKADLENYKRFDVAY